MFFGTSPNPMETVAAALGACMAMSLSQALKAMRERLDEVELQLSYEERTEEPRVFDYFNIHIVFRGDGLSPPKLEKALTLTEETYCPVSVMLESAGVELRTTFSIEQKKTG